MMAGNTIPNSGTEPRNKEATLTLATAKEKDQLQQIIDLGEHTSVFKHNEIFQLFPSEFLTELKILSKQLYIKQAGVSAGSFKGKSFVPEHALALSTFNHQFPKSELSKEEALSYLRKQDIKPDAAQGWCLMTYLGLGLGWIKNLPNRANNYYPSEWRILKR